MASQRFARKYVSKKLRFEVFKRDAFRCRYCGVSNADESTLLVVDHIVPVAEGGATAFENLVTACEPCNQGKGGRSLGEAAVYPKMDEANNEMRQNIAEMAKYLELHGEWETNRNIAVSAIQSAFALHHSEDWVPAEWLINQLLTTYDPEVVTEAVIALAIAMSRNQVSQNASHWVRYLWGICRKVDESRVAG